MYVGTCMFIYTTKKGTEWQSRNVKMKKKKKNEKKNTHTHTSSKEIEETLCGII